MEVNEKKITFKKALTSIDHEKKLDETTQILYELYCQYRLKKSVHNQLNNDKDASGRCP